VGSALTGRHGALGEVDALSFVEVLRSEASYSVTEEALTV
jgi:hypothetical protein